MRRSFLALIVAFTATVPAAGGAEADDPPELTVTPSTDLVDGQLVSLEQSVEVPNTILPIDVTVATCLTEWTGARPCNTSTLSVPFVFMSTLDEARVARFVEADDGSIIDCASVACSLVYTETACVNRGQPVGTCAFIESVSVETPVTFDDRPGIGTIGLWYAGDDVRVVGTGMASAEPGSPAAAFAVQCAFLAAGGLACGGGSGAIETDFDGEYDETMTLQPTFAQNGVDANCGRDHCLVVVIVLGANYEIIDVQATHRDWGQLRALPG